MSDCGTANLIIKMILAYFCELFTVQPFYLLVDDRGFSKKNYCQMSQFRGENPYTLLGLTPPTTPQQVKIAFKKLALRWCVLVVRQ